MKDTDIEASIERHREESRARFPLNAEGVPECLAHGYTLGEKDWGCPKCEAIEREQRERQRALEYHRMRAGAWFPNSVMDVEGLGGLPRWTNHEERLAKSDPRIVRELLPLDLTRTVLVAARTGAGKTSVIVAGLNQINDKLLADVEKGPVKLPQKFVYCTGSDLAECEKRRRLGEEHHALVEAARKRPLLILDEISRAPVDLMFAIVDARVQRDLPTIALCGIPSEEFGVTFGANVLRRFLDAGKVLDCFPSARKVAAVR